MQLKRSIESYPVTVKIFLALKEKCSVSFTGRYTVHRKKRNPSVLCVLAAFVVWNVDLKPSFRNP